MEASVQLPEAAPYWELIKNASNNIKLALISMLSESIRIGTKTPPQKTALQLSPAEIREQKAKELNLYRLEGKEYIVKGGDIVNIRFNV